jgi:GntR family transcriptional regulator / MocR family aminotransferase
MNFYGPAIMGTSEMIRSWNLNLNLSKKSGLAIYLQITQQIIDEIQRGRLLPSTAMPGSRELAEKLNVNRKTILTAYDELVAQGWLTTEHRRGTFVSASLPQFSQSKTQKVTAKLPVTVSSAQLEKYATSDGNIYNSIEFNDGIPDTRLIPFETLSKAFRHALIAPIRSNKLGYGDPRGTLPLRLAIAEMVNMERGLNVEIDNICIARGSQMGIFLAARIFISQGDCVVVENLSYPPAREAFRSCGANILTVNVDAHGIDVVELEAVCKKQSIRAIYVTPHHQFPTTVMMTAERRLKLLLLAHKYDFFIVEDDYDHEFHFEHHPVLPLASNDNLNRVIYVGSLSKVLAPGLRVGYIIASKEIIDRCALEVMLIDRQGNTVAELAVAELMDTGEVKRHIRRTLKTYRERRSLFIDLLNNQLGDYINFEQPSGGLAIWIRLNESTQMEHLLKQAALENVRILPGSLFSASQSNINGIRLGFGSLNPTELVAGIRRLKYAFSKHSHVNSIPPITIN